MDATHLGQQSRGDSDSLDENSSKALRRELIMICCSGRPETKWGQTIVIMMGPYRSKRFVCFV